ncbi:uncharacterized protein Tco025E_00653 [Trypanosoma conorhini]|uniref:Uncharacterized protein n=1 Tax=Trypanosoma conorhini TaxID=83891 RepID=A0A3R7NU54_9TRYP|nr:uncharacterized protein Tco025E_00653 [Trypanosoma conorhini]RNF27099.1 hypothetical protein Tco025E_00653 [Trypanosoma conorhini]
MGHDDNEAIGCKALSRNIQQQLSKQWWCRRLRRSRRSKHAEVSSAASSSCSSVGIQLFSTFFVTPKELAARLRKREKFLERRQRQRQRIRRRELNQLLHGSRLCKEEANATLRVVSGVSGGGHVPLALMQPGVSEDDAEELSSMLTTSRLLFTSVNRSAAACVGVRAASRTLRRECHGLASWICPMLLHTASRTRRAFCNTPLLE